ncbi:hypothetical protein Nepgr_015303 [Nepenthes gracilis]|uniref:Uncharacterized protein n=1 Tax=Nepenthes gracilis TaxID=150966 RepID=A0AAD3SLV1_NEPGR|nr:hypothetical protein Nepgr_015303 [Nepenthes gracilis]
MVLLKVLFARPSIDLSLPMGHVNRDDWAMKWKRNAGLEKIISPALVNRPTIGDVLWNLEYALQLQEASSQGKVEDKSTRLPATAVANSWLGEETANSAG